MSVYARSGTIKTRSAIPRLCFVDIDRSTIEIGSIQGFNCLASRFVIDHLDESEAAKSAGVSIVDELDVGDFAKLREELPRFLRRVRLRCRLRREPV